MGKCTWVGKGLCSSPVDADWTAEAELRYGLCVVNYVASNCISQSPDVLEFRKKYSLSLSNTEIYAGRSRDLNWKISRFYGPFQNFLNQGIGYYKIPTLQISWRGMEQPTLFVYGCAGII